MAEPGEKQSGRLAGLWALFGMLFLGVFYVPQLRPTSSEAPQTLESTVLESGEQGDGYSPYAPLRAFFGPGAEDKTFDDPPGHQDYEFRYLVAIVPDPLDSRFGYRFDVIVAALEQAAERCGYVLDRWTLPWEHHKPGDELALARRAFLQAIAAPAGATASEEIAQARRLLLQLERPFEHQPGVLLFRQVATGEESRDARANGSSKSGPTADARQDEMCGNVSPSATIENQSSSSRKLLFMFLVGETPTAGIHQRAFQAALDYAGAVPWLGEKGQQELRVVGPNFSGSQDSLNRAINTWSRARGERQQGVFPIRIISGNATSIEPENIPKGVKFQATVHPDAVVRGYLMSYLRRTFGNHKTGRIGMLVESSTGFGNKVLLNEAEVAKNPERVVQIPFPLHISHVRSAFDRDRALHQQNLPQLDALRPGVPIPFDPDIDSRDSVPTFFAPMTAAIADTTLNGILSTIIREDLRFVGIVASDTRDKIFLASLIRSRCPDVQLFLTDSDILFTHREYNFDLKGTLVAATYPLDPSNQLWSYPFNGLERRYQFAAQNVQGIFNATVAQLGCTDEMLGYSAPFEKTPGLPSVWFLLVGQGMMYPLGTSQMLDLDNETRNLQTKTEQYMFSRPDDDSRHSRGLPVVLVEISRLFLSAVVLLCVFGWINALAAEEASRRSFKEPDPRSGTLVPAYWPLHSPDVVGVQWLHSGICLGVPLALCLLMKFILACELRRANECFNANRDWDFVEPVFVSLVATSTIAALLVSLVTHSSRASKVRKAPKGSSFPLPEAGGLGTGAQYAGWVTVLTILLAVLEFTYFSSGSVSSQYYFFARRSSDLSAGVTVVVPLIFTGLGLYIWSLTHLKRLDKADRLGVKCAFPGRDKKAEELRLQIEKPLILGTLMTDLRGLTGWTMLIKQNATLLFYPLIAFAACLRFVPTFEPLGLDYMFLGLFLCLAFSVVQNCWYLYRLWTKLKDYCRQLMLHPMNRAYDRLPEAARTLIGRFADGDLPSHSLLRVAAAQWHEVVKKSGELFEEFQATPPNTPRPGVNACIRLKTRPGVASTQIDETFATESDDWAGQFCAADLACADMPDERVSLARDSWQQAFTTASQRGVELLAAIWPHREAAHLYCKAPVGKVTDTHGRPLADPVLAWAASLEDAIATQVVIYVSQFFFHLRNLLAFLVAACVALLLGVSSYPFQPERLLLFFAWAVILGVAVVIGMVFLQMDRSEFVSRITKTAPNQLTIDRTFVVAVGKYIGLLLLLLALQFEEFAALLYTWVEPILRALR